MPLNLVSLTGLFAETSTMILLPFMGWLTDRGSNPKRRKTVAIIFTAGLIISGVTCVLVANMMHLIYLLDYSARMGSASNKSLSWNTSVLIDSFENRPVGVFGVPGNVSGKGTHFQHESGSLRSFKVQDYAVEYLMDAQESLGASDEVRTGRGCSSVA